MWICEVRILILLVGIACRHTTLSCEAKLSNDVANRFDADCNTFLLSTLETLYRLLLILNSCVFRCLSRYSLLLRLSLSLDRNRVGHFRIVKRIISNFLVIFYLGPISPVLWISIWRSIFRLSDILVYLTVLKFADYESRGLLLLRQSGIWSSDCDFTHTTK